MAYRHSTDGVHLPALSLSPTKPHHFQNTCIWKNMLKELSMVMVDMESLHEIMFACVGTVTEIEANADTFYATAGATSGALGELASTIRQEVEGLEEAMRLSRIVTRLQMQEASLRTNLVQAKHKRDHDMGVAFVAPATAASGWCY
uniref:Uncharacterized protein n=1 Tax=Aegilops tauschii TaxID=37682 RepID=M8CL61_AEGTA